jgi:predicted ribosomally synthesized peptide with SipW-like signal peptide
MSLTKKKGLVLAVAIALVAALVIGGTLMLFTAQSATATNVVTVGDLKIELWEDDTLVDGTIFDGLKFTDIDPSALIEKDPVVYHRNGTDAYLRVKAEFSFENIDPAHVKSAVSAISTMGGFGKTWTELIASGSGVASGDEIKAIATAIYSVAQNSVGSDWVFRFAPSTGILGDMNNPNSAVDSATGVITGYYYYADGSGLKTFSQGATTGSVYTTDGADGIKFPIITGITSVGAWSSPIVATTKAIPADGGIDASEFGLSGQTVNIVLTAQAVQKEGNPGTGTAPNTFKSYFNFQSLQ